LQQSTDEARQQTLGVAAAIGAFLIWAGFPVFFKAVSGVLPTEVLAHRIVWALVLIAILMTVSKRWPEMRKALRDGSTRARLFATAVLVSINWLVFIWGITNDRVLECSLGYFINPLVNVVLGVIFLQERLGPLRWIAVALAAAGVGYQIIGLGYVPWIALTLGFSFGFYGLIRKQTQVGSLAGLGIETMFLTPLALIYLLWLEQSGVGSFGHMGLQIDVLLVLAGVVTATPLMLFAAAARRIRLSTIGLLQYIAPTGHFVLAVWIYNEPFTAAHLVTFGCIWVALGLYSWESMRVGRTVSS
jgi:chloramphenicol-sensitive protein RarD